MTINSGLNGRAVRALMELGSVKNQNEILRMILIDTLGALRRGLPHEKIAEDIEDAIENLGT